MAKSVNKMHKKLRKHGSRWFDRRHGDKNNNNYEYQDHHSNSHARTKRREYSPGDGLNMDSANQKPQFEDKPHYKQKQSNHEQVRN